jgi:hypothetical protein
MENMLEPDWQQERPDSAAIIDMWKQLDFHNHLFESSSVVTQLLESFKDTHSNGGAFFGCFSFEYHPVLHWFLSRNRWDEIEFPEHFLKSHALKERFPELCRSISTEAFGFEWGSSYTIAGYLAQSLANGGAYEKFKDGPAGAYYLTNWFCNWLIEDRFEDVIVLRTYNPWSGWFYGIAWDQTWLIIDKRNYRVWLLAITDTD